jgi:hypothetical protein
MVMVMAMAMAVMMLQDAEVRRLAAMMRRMEDEALRQRKEYDQVRVRVSTAPSGVRPCSCGSC